jgi:single-stranded-DNA-specific exonuclease
MQSLNGQRFCRIMPRFAIPLPERNPVLRSSNKTWRLMAHDAAAIDQLVRTVGVSPILAQLLLNRGFQDGMAIRRYLTMPFNGLHDPSGLPGLTDAAERLHRAVREGKTICVYGDYDVDGLTGTAILWQTLRLLGAAVELCDFYVPHRLEEGYGLNNEALGNLARRGCSVVVTVDCGIGSLAEADEARRLGLELIVTDHHEFRVQHPQGQCLPCADCIVHPRLPGGQYPFGDLSGSGVALKLAWALCQRACGAERVTPRLREFLLDCVGLAALGMIADCVPLVDENRIIVRHGLARLREAPSVGFQALLEAAGLAERRCLTAADIAYFLAPRLNAAGRLGCARLVVELLTTPSRERATFLARFLEGQNSKRQAIERRILDEAHEMLARADLSSGSALVLASKEWHAGVIGIVAGRLTEQFNRPTLLIALREESAVGQGSGRSIPGFRLHEALQACGDDLLGHGGHAAAVGFKIAASQVERFRERFCAYAAQFLPESPAPPRLVIDAEVPLCSITPGLVDALWRLEPYGIGNPRPRFLAGPVQINGTPRRVGKGERHLQFRVRQDDAHFPVIAFGMSDRAEELMSAQGTCCLVFMPTFNEWQGRRLIQLEVVDFQPGAEARLE